PTDRRGVPMQFAGEQLEVILRRQDVPVEVVDFSGRVCMSASGQEVLGRFVLAGYVGIGNHSRIRLVKPEGVRYRPEEFGAQRQVVMNFRESAQVAHDVELNRVAKGAKTWPQQPARAKTGRCGTTSTIHFRT
ncbi:MAG: hypothetical protein NTW28_28530, partial [Candidatus Solibacter sp.]|nr:hypothetical protein [Candidatus Solibacter sp.]